MKPHFVNLVNALTMVILGGWAYLEKDAPTALIPVFIGAILWLQTEKIKANDKTAAHIAVALTALAAIGLLMPLRREANMGDTMGVLRSVLMLISCLFALFAFVKTFIDARRA
jgi:surface polysaccharide O-acyltransferase-like enzyme